MIANIWVIFMEQTKAGVLQGTLDLMILKTLESMGTLHGYGIARPVVPYLTQ